MGPHWDNLSRISGYPKTPALGDLVLPKDPGSQRLGPTPGPRVSETWSYPRTPGLGDLVLPRVSETWSYPRTPGLGDLISTPGPWVSGFWWPGLSFVVLGQCSPARQESSSVVWVQLLKVTWDDVEFTCHDMDMTCEHTWRQHSECLELF